MRPPIADRRRERAVYVAGGLRGVRAPWGIRAVRANREKMGAGALRAEQDGLSFGRPWNSFR